MKSTITNKRLVAYFYSSGLENVSFGVSFNWRLPNIEVHVPFGFFRIGIVGRYHYKQGSKGLKIGYDSER